MSGLSVFSGGRTNGINLCTDKENIYYGSPMRNIAPSLKALKAFEVAARHLSFSEAAKELFVTPAAVGQLVKTLEMQMDTPLFVRHSGGQTRLQLSARAAQALPDIQAGFACLEKGVRQLRKNVDSPFLTVTVSTAFASKWLLPRLDSFQASFSDISLNLNMDNRSLDFVEHQVDVGIRYGAGHWQGLVAEKLWDEEIFPVCSPYFQAPQSPRELADAMLIHDMSMAEESRVAVWQAWFADAGIGVSAPAYGLRMNSAAAVLQAAIDGQGIALARSIMAADDLAAGRLVRLFPEITCASAWSYWLVYLAESEKQAKIRAFKRWLQAQTV